MSSHPAFIPPDNPNIKIWRYMDFTKFVAMLEDGGLFFCRSDLLGDPFEGSFPQANIDLRSKRNQLILESIADRSEDEKAEALSKLEATANQEKYFAQWNRQWTMVNCWHMNDYESVAMWSLYAKSSESIAIQSTFIRLSDCLNSVLIEGSKPRIGIVRYVDYPTGGFPPDNLFYAYLHKRKAFEHEHELRSIVWVPPFRPGTGPDFEAVPPDGGLLIQVDLANLVEKVFVSPKSLRWYRELVEKMLAKYSLDKPVIQSSLDSGPLF